MVLPLSHRTRLGGLCFLLLKLMRQTVQTDFLHMIFDYPSTRLLSLNVVLPSRPDFSLAVYFCFYFEVVSNVS